MERTTSTDASVLLTGAVVGEKERKSCPHWGRFWLCVCQAQTGTLQTLFNVFLLLSQYLINLNFLKSYLICVTFRFASLMSKKTVPEWALRCLRCLSRGRVWKIETLTLSWRTGELWEVSLLPAEACRSVWCSLNMSGMCDGEGADP